MCNAIVFVTTSFVFRERTHDVSEHNLNSVKEIQIMVFGLSRNSYEMNMYSEYTIYLPVLFFDGKQLPFVVND